MRIHGWGRYPSIEAEVLAPGTPTEMAQALARIDGPVLARGLGRSYGDSALAPLLIGTSRLNLLLDFDAATGIVRCDAGVSLADLIEVFLPRGWFLPVTPGTKFVTVGGAIASDVHGKNHHRDGCFSAQVLAIDVLLASGDILTCSRSERPDLFQATCGGMGLTGIVTRATLRLRKVDGPMIAQTTLRARNLEEACDLFDAHGSATYSVAWIDCMASGTSLGRSLLMLGEHAPGGASLRAGKPLSGPVGMLSPFLNRWSIKAFNQLYYRRARTAVSTQLVHAEPYFYPLDRIHEWNRMYGARGFIQYQFVLPKAAGRTAMRNILERIAASHRGSFLAVLKAFGPGNANFLSFPCEGYTLALDFKIDDGLFVLLDELDAMVLDSGGRLYLAKDARMSESTFKRSYPHWEQFQEVRARYGALGRFGSSQSQRLGL